VIPFQTKVKYTLN